MPAVKQYDLTHAPIPRQRHRLAITIGVEKSEAPINPHGTYTCFTLHPLDLLKIKAAHNVGPRFRLPKSLQALGRT